MCVCVCIYIYATQKPFNSEHFTLLRTGHVSSTPLSPRNFMLTTLFCMCSRSVTSVCHFSLPVFKRAHMLRLFLITMNGCDGRVEKRIGIKKIYSFVLQRI